MSKNVLIPRSTLVAIIDMMESLDIARLPNYFDYIDILRQLKVKMQKLDLRDAYAQIISADDPDSMHHARMQYLSQKRYVGKVDV